MEELFELTVNNYKQPTTLPLRTYYLTTILPLRTQGALKEHQRSRWEKTISTKSMSSRSVCRCRRRRLIDVDDVDLEVTEGLYWSTLKSLMEENSRRTVVLSSLIRTLATPNLGCISEIKMKKCFFILYFARFALTLPQKIENGHLCALTSSRFFLNW